jgi:hypothetical protein
VSRRRAAIGLVALAVLGSACRRPPADALAVFDGGAVTRSELDARIRALPAAERKPADGDFAAWHDRLLRELALEEILLAEAQTPGRAVPDRLRAAFREIDHQAAATAYLEAHVGRAPPPSEDEVRRAFEDWKAEYAQAEHRQVFHLFRRLPSPAEADRVVGEVRRARERVVAGENFRLVAAELSDSETRHRDGLMGWFGRGQLAPDLEAVVFALPVRSPSEPIRTTSGVHMFWVETILPARQFTYDEVKTLVARRLGAARFEEQARALVHIDPPVGSFVPDREALATLLQAGDPQALILRVGDYELRAAELRRRLAEAGGGGGAPGPFEVVQGLEMRELLYLQCREEGCDRAPEVGRRAAAQRERALTRHELHEQLRARILADRARLVEYYERNENRFSEPIRWRLTRAIMPLGEDPNARMAALEAARPALDRGERRLEEVAVGLGGRVEEMAWQPLGALQAASLTLGEVVARLEPGRHSPPFRRGEALEMVRCEERTQPVPLPLERVMDRVAEDLLANEGQERYREMVDQLLAERAFRQVGDPVEGGA